MGSEQSCCGSRYIASKDTESYVQSFSDRQYIASKDTESYAQSFSKRQDFPLKDAPSYAQSFSDRQYMTLKNAPSYTQSFSKTQHFPLKDMRSYAQSFSDRQHIPLRNTQSFWERRQIIYFDVDLVISQALNYEKPNGSFSSGLLSAHFTKELGQSHQQGFSLPQCLQLCNSKELYLYDVDVLSEYGVYSESQLMMCYEKLKSDIPTNGMKMPHVKAVKIFEDINVLNEVLEHPGVLNPLMTPQTAPTKFEMIQESLKSGMVIVKMKSEEIMITSCSDDELSSVDKRRISRRQFNENATEACFIDDLRMIIFQDFSMKNNSAPSKADLIVEVLNEKKKPVMVGLRIDGFLKCVLIANSDRNFLYAMRWTEGRVDSLKIRFDYFNENVIEAYFFDNRSASSRIKGSSVEDQNSKIYSSYIQAADTKITDRDKYGYEYEYGGTGTMRRDRYEYAGMETTSNQKHGKTTGTGGNQEQGRTTGTGGNQEHRRTAGTGGNQEHGRTTGTRGNQERAITTETRENNGYYDSVIFKSIEGLGSRLRPGTFLDYPKLVLNSQFELFEAELAKVLENNGTIEVGVAYPNGLHLTGRLSRTSRVTKRFVYRKIKNQEPILLSYAQDANKNNPTHKRLWGLEIANQLETHPPKLTAFSLHIMVGDEIIPYLFPERTSWIESHTPFPSNRSGIFHKDCTNPKALKRIARQIGDPHRNEYQIPDRKIIAFEEWPIDENCQGFLVCLKFIGAEARDLYCGLVRAKSPDVEDRLLVEFSELF